jgi:arylsulfatase A-like enzyme
MVGKWHLGGGSEKNEPRGRGFDHFYGFLGGFIDYYKPTAREDGPVDWQRNGKALDEEGYSTDLFAQEAVRLLKGRDRSRPVFLHVAFNAPHAPHQAPEALLQKYQMLGDRGPRSAFAAVVDAMDQAIGKVLATLDDEGMHEDTLVMFFCDNGGGGGSGRDRRRGRHGRSGRCSGPAGNTWRRRSRPARTSEDPAPATPLSKINANKARHLLRFDADVFFGMHTSGPWPGHGSRRIRRRRGP